MKKNRHAKHNAFTLIELLIVIALLGAFAIGFLATIDPFEQLKKGRDTSRIHLTSDFYNAMVRVYSAKQAIPVTTDVFGIALSSPQAQEVIHELEKLGELKSGFEKHDANELDDIYLSASKDGKTLSVCFRPESKSYITSKETAFNQFGVKTDCTSSECNICTGESDESQVAMYTSQMNLSLCKTLGAECEINNSEKTCCDGLTCKLNNPQSSNGKCVVSSEITPTPTPTVVNCSANPVPTPTVVNCSTSPVPPPTVSISASDCVVPTGTPFTITVSASSCTGLASVWWYGAGGPDVTATLHISYPPSPTASQMFTVPFTNPTRLRRAYGSPYFTAEQAVHDYSFTSTIIISTPGTYTFGSNSRDVLYPIPGQPHQASEGMGLQFAKIQVVDN